MARGRGRSRGERPHYEWSHIGDEQNSNALPGKIVGTTGLTIAVPSTIRRTRGTVGCVLDTGAVNEHVMVTCGLVLISGDAFAAGAASIPGPASDRDQDWLWTGQLFLTSGNEAAIISDRLSGELKIDSKAMRVVRAGQVIALMVEVVAGEMRDQAGALDFVYGIDFLASV